MNVYGISNVLDSQTLYRLMLPIVTDRVTWSVGLLH